MHKGRRRELIIAAVLYALGGLITAYTPSLGILLVGRLLYGLGIGWVSLKLNIFLFFFLVELVDSMGSVTKSKHI